MSDAEKTYGDINDRAISSMTPDRLFDKWNRFEDTVFSALNADEGIGRGVFLSAGAGRRVPEPEAPFFNSFAKTYLLEPDNERRAALAENTKGSGAILLSDRIEDLDAAAIAPADFVQCKYVLQHIHTELLPLAVERLKSVVAKNGVIGIFSAVSPGESYFNLAVPEDSRHLVPADLGSGSGNRITEAQFNRLMSTPQDFPFIATHHISLQTLQDYFAGWDPTLEMGFFDVCFLRARQPAISKMKKFLNTMKAMVGAN